ncbi:MAG: hypothetical protein QMC39_02415 [Flavobacteriales bacterium]|jgi:hypothetical protein|tara:strand:- start:696 stop:2591 length:1896 start_codon:yes stop_codon:yes gene_type:complete
MKYIITVALLFLFLSVQSQEKKKMDHPNKGKILDEFTALHIPESSIWMGVDQNIESYRYVENRLLIYNFWSPLSLVHENTLSQLEALKRDIPEIEIIDFLHPDDLDLFTPDEAYELWKVRVSQRPLVIGVNDKIANMSLNRDVGNIMLTIDRAGFTYLDLNSNLEVVRGVAKVWAEEHKKSKSAKLSFPTYPINKTLHSEFFNFPQSITADELDLTLYVCDTGNNRIVGIESSGMLLDVIGDGTVGYRDGHTTQSKFNKPQGIVFDSNERVLYVADTYNHVIRKVDLASYQVSTYLGTGEEAVILDKEIRLKEKALAFPQSLELKNGFLYISMINQSQVYKVELATGAGIRIAGTSSSMSQDGRIEEASLSHPNSMCFKDEKLYLLERITPKVRCLDKKSIKTIYQAEPEDSIQLNFPGSIHSIGNSIYILDSFNHSVRKLSDEGLSHVTGSVKGFKDGSLKEALFNAPIDLCTMSGNIYVLDALNSAIRIVNPKAESVSTLKLEGTVDVYKQLSINKLEIRETVAYAMKGQNLVALKIELPDGEAMGDSGIEIENQTGSIGEVISTDSPNGIILIAVDVKDFSETTYLSLKFESTLIEVPNHKKLYTLKSLIKYEESSDKSKLGNSLLQL